jgi:protein pelota
MRILAQEKDETTLVPETLNDLWSIYTQAKGKIFWQKTLRTSVICKGGEIQKGKKKPVYLGILAQKASFEGNKIRITGLITEGEERNKHHSIYIELEKKAKIIGELEGLPKSAKREILVCVCDKSKTLIALLKGGRFYEIEEILSKRREEEYFKEVSTNLKRKSPNYLLIAGPDKIRDKIRQRIELPGKVFSDSVSSGGKSGLEEIAKRSIVREILEKQREDEEKKAVEEMLSEVRKNPQKTMYGLDANNQPERAKELIVLSEFAPKYEAALKSAQAAGCRIRIVDSSKDYARELKKFEIVGVGRW